MTCFCFRPDGNCEKCRQEGSFLVGQDSIPSDWFKTITFRDRDDHGDVTIDALNLETDELVGIFDA